MAWQKTHKKNTKEKILISAASLFTKNGFDSVSIDQVMQHAQLTRGAFYAHFNSKSDLYAQAIAKAAKLAMANSQQVEIVNIKTISQFYLSKEHRDDQFDASCPLACLVTDITTKNDDVKTAYTQVFKGFINNTQSLTTDRDRALQNAVLMIGGLALAKALNDKELSDNLLQACQNGINTLE